MNKLRDHIAGAVLREQLRGLMNGAFNDLNQKELEELAQSVKAAGSTEKYFARVAYAYADAMLEAREETRRGK